MSDEPAKLPDEQKDILPALMEKHIQLTIPDDLPHNATLNQVKQVDMQVANTLLQCAYMGLGSVTTVQQLCKMIDTTGALLERRRKLLNLQYGAENKSSAGAVYEPLD